MRDLLRKIQILRKGKTSLPRTALVFDEAHTELRGILRRRDIMRGLEPKFFVDGAPEVQAKVLNIEMESGTILTLANLFGLRAGCICTVSDRAPWPGPGMDAIDLDNHRLDRNWRLPF